MSAQRSAGKTIVVIEHCEETLSPWLLLEYRHSSMIFGRDSIWFTNIPIRYYKILSRYGVVKTDSILDILNRGEISPYDVIVLDPQAPQPLTYERLVSKKYVVIGGILGDHPPRGRTRKYITSRMPSGVEAYNIGDKQYSIDGSVYYIHYLIEHKGLEGYKYVDKVVIDLGYRSITLPYRYPVVNDKPLLAYGLEYYLLHGTIPEEIWRELITDKKENQT